MTLVQRVAAIYEELRMDVYRYVLTLGVGPETAQEITQEAFLRLYETLRNSARVENMRAWLLRVAHNLAVNHFKSAASKTEQPVEYMPTNAGPEAQLIEEERRSRLREEVSRLSTQQRACLELRSQGLRYREIGDVMGISASAVGEFLRRAIVLLRRALE